MKHNPTCPQCGRKRTPNKKCLHCIKAKNKAYYALHKDKLSEAGKQRNRAKRQACLDHYGGHCACCGEKRVEFLAIDHVNGGGSKHRLELFGKRNAGGPAFYSWLKKNGFPTGYRVLCHNCNTSLGLYGYCPHQRDSTCPSTSIPPSSQQPCRTEAGP